MRNQEAEMRAVKAAQDIRRLLPLDHDVRIGIVLGTGWGDVLQLENVRELPFGEITGFDRLPAGIEGHARKLVHGTVEGRPVLALKGRMHLNEHPIGGFLNQMVRLQIEMLLQLGVRDLILTCAVGSLGRRFEVGQVCIVDGFVTVFAPTMPLYGGEFCSPEDALSEDLRRIAGQQGICLPQGAAFGGHAMLRGPFFEGRKYDKALLAASGASVVGMSVLPEACVAALYPGVRVLALAFVTNDDAEEHSHEENQRRAKASADRLGEYLAGIVGRLPVR